MKNLYLYGASDDCCECETDFNEDYESYCGIKINEIEAHYYFDGDWGIKLIGDIPETWIVRCINGNCCGKFRYQDFSGQFIHIQIPDGENVKFSSLNSD